VLILDIKLNEVPLILRTSCHIPNVRSQGSMEETVESVQLWKEVLDLGRSGHDTWSIHELHLIKLECDRTTSGRGLSTKISFSDSRRSENIINTHKYNTNVH
jgi:hypothetical protein